MTLDINRLVALRWTTYNNTPVRVAGQPTR